MGIASLVGFRWLRKLRIDTPVTVVANKVEGGGDRWEDNINEFFKLGFGKE